MRALIVATLVVASGLARASDPPPTSDAEQSVDALHQYQRGLAAYNSASYEAAIEAFTASYRLSGDPELLFNIAQAHRHRPGGCGDAFHFYREYIRLEPDVARRTSAEPLAASASTCADREAQAKPATVAIPAAAPAAPPPWYRDVAGDTLVAGGVAALGVGIGVYAASTAAADDAARASTEGQLASRFGTAQAERTGAIVCLAGGGALTVAGIVRFLVHRGGPLRRHATPHLDASAGAP
jgi:hypothetical protein